MSRLARFVQGPARARGVWLLTFAMLAIGLAVHFAWARDLEPMALDVRLPWWAFALCLAVIEYPTIKLIVRNEGHSFTLGELALCLGLFLVDPGQLVLAVAVGAALAKFRFPPIKIAFNVALWVLQAALAVSLAHMIGDPSSPFGLRSVIATLGAMAIIGLIGSVAVLLAITLVQSQVRVRVAVTATAITMAVNVANSGLGLIGVYLIATDPHLVFALAGPIIALFLAYRAFVIEHQEHQRLQLVYQTTRSVLEAPEIGSAVASVLAQAREVLRAEIAQVVLYPERPGEAIVVQTLGPGDVATTTAVPGLGTSVFAAMELTKAAEIVKEADVPFRGGLVDVPRDSVRGMLVAPLEGERRLVGAIAVANRIGDTTSFDGADLRLLATLAGHAGVAIGNGRLERTLEELTAVQSELSRRATQDPLTGLANRAHFAQALQSALDGRAGAEVGVIYVDLDDFKLVNDRFGHAGGDQTLCELATRLAASLRGNDLAGRLGGDEFAVMVDGVRDIAQLSAMADRLRESLERPLAVSDAVLSPGVSLGVALAGGVSDAEELLGRGDTAMYHAKRSGKGRAAIFDVSMGHAHSDRVDTVDAIRRALDRNELVVHYQPIVALPSRTVAGVEALVRWQRPGVGLVPPGAFMPLVEESGLAALVGEWVIREACGQVARWNLSGVGPGDLGVSVNVSPAHAADPDLERRVMEAVHASGLRPDLLTLEVTEAVLSDRRGSSDAGLAALRTRGVRIGIDDFGTGVSTLADLGNRPVDLLKIPGAFMEAEVAGRPTLADALVTIGRTLGIPTVAESIETDDQVDRLEALGCEFVQGHAFAPALPAEQVELMLVAGPSDGRLALRSGKPARV